MRKSIFICAIAILLVTGVAGLSIALEQTAPAKGPQVKLLSSVDVDETINGQAARASTVEVTFQPGASSPPHRHPGPVFGYVIEGELEFKIEGKPQRTLKTGQTFYEPQMVLHEVGRNPGAKAKTRVLAVIVHPRTSKELVIPELPKPIEAE